MLNTDAIGISIPNRFQAFDGSPNTCNFYKDAILLLVCYFGEEGYPFYPIALKTCLFWLYTQELGKYHRCVYGPIDPTLT